MRFGGGDLHPPGHVRAPLPVCAPYSEQSTTRSSLALRLGLPSRHIRAARLAEHGWIPLGLALMLRAPALPAHFRERDEEFWVTRSDFLPLLFFSQLSQGVRSPFRHPLAPCIHTRAFVVFEGH